MTNYVLVFTAMLSCVPAYAVAAPMVVLRDEFAALQAGRQVVVEDFQGFNPLGPQTSPVQLANGTFTSRMPSIAEHTNDGVREIFNLGSPYDFRIFGDLPAGTVAWGVAVYEPPFVARHYDIVVVGKSGTLELTDYENYFFFGNEPGFFGVYDPDGLVSVSVRSRNLDGVYGFSDVTTISIPEPTADMTAGTAVISILGFVLWRRGRAR